MLIICLSKWWTHRKLWETFCFKEAIFWIIVIFVSCVFLFGLQLFIVMLHWWPHLSKPADAMQNILWCIFAFKTFRQPFFSTFHLWMESAKIPDNSQLILFVCIWTKSFRPLIKTSRLLSQWPGIWHDKRPFNSAPAAVMLAVIGVSGLSLLFRLTLVIRHFPLLALGLVRKRVFDNLK